jgi:hypothetical protein
MSAITSPAAMSLAALKPRKPALSCIVVLAAKGGCTIVNAQALVLLMHQVQECTAQQLGLLGIIHRVNCTLWPQHQVVQYLE